MIRRRGVALVVVLFVGLLLTITGYALLLAGTSGEAEAVNFSREQVLWQAALSALERGVAALPDDPYAPTTRGAWWSDEALGRFAVGDSVALLINPVEVQGDGAQGGIVGLVPGATGLSMGGTDRSRYGVSDENGRLNLNTATRGMLMKLPGMTEEIADSILRWRGEDTGGRGAGDEYYMTLDPPYRLKGAPFETIAELLLVRGVTAQLLFGEDVNANGVLDPAEDDGDANPPADNMDGRLDRGWLPFVTVWSYDLNLDSTGQPRVNVNRADYSALRAVGFSESDANSILAARAMIGGSFPSVAALLSVPGVERRELRAVIDRLSVTDDPVLPGLINVNTAPAEVLKALPGMNDERVARVVEARQNPETDTATILWLLGPLDPDTFQQVAPFVTVRSLQFRMDATAVDPARGLMRRMFGVWDANPIQPGWLYVADVTSWGIPAPFAAREAVP
jgi:type II secretory pathway component PulK